MSESNTRLMFPRHEHYHYANPRNLERNIGFAPILAGWKPAVLLLTLVPRKTGCGGLIRTSTGGFKDHRPTFRRHRNGSEGLIRTTVATFRGSRPTTRRLPNKSKLGSGGRIRTCGGRINSALPCHLATPEHIKHKTPDHLSVPGSKNSGILDSWLHPVTRFADVLILSRIDPGCRYRELDLGSHCFNPHCVCSEVSVWNIRCRMSRTILR